MVVLLIMILGCIVSIVMYAYKTLPTLKKAFDISEADGTFLALICLLASWMGILIQAPIVHLCNKKMKFNDKTR